ncbi:methylmalonate semialdehyde dehydrogenase [Cupriavidus necator N-1]|uniref:aldehyde dehydrogenase (NAD(+)) n=1 Tax=Cupriavidus necator (strain ATCC 43291 / DSM 13513 / CCUG 52238 / LMG 8453 / N-1) TaxID=1042878 RepID=G0EXX5_CUPNN|nr:MULTISPECIES: aldehyde dehydrogenase family protein [Cupriavidus]AEI78588.1 methylmalonate semialdehyde dehydrogenase [Cupriavidus necator N-1]KAI3609723.1 Aldehyde dehydrogenase B [Cupriavidus necator H850]MDX6012888.1 aldehyde dehydrogenase family protein [Cupriavidus necator]QUN28041.1 aldehyde dehydrogenase family protein [Cupriavidus sp. KK10]
MKAQEFAACWDSLGLPRPWREGAPAGTVTVRSPVDGEAIGHVPACTPAQADALIARAHAAQTTWALLPAPARGEIVRRFGEVLREHKPALGRLVSLESGKILQEGLGEVQEMIDICDFAVGLSRQLHGLTIASERPQHAMRETWHPYGLCGVISAFNFPVAVWAWNAALALVCGNGVIWKPSERVTLCALAAHGLLERVLAAAAPQHTGISAVLPGGRMLGTHLVSHPAVRLVSATGSTRMGREVGIACAGHFKRSILELGGNNAAIVAPSADIELAVRAITFAAAGTAGQRCTTLRRCFIHADLMDTMASRLITVFDRLPVGDPLADGTLVGPLIDTAAGDAMANALAACRAQGNIVTGGERLLADRYPHACYVRPALVMTDEQHDTMLTETFAPILYMMPYTTLDEAIALNNAAAHGLSSCIFTESMREAERFLSSAGSDCGIANVNIGTSGAEIGGAFGGEKATGGGRESGSDAWKGYMRRATNTINYGDSLPLAQGIRFEI